MVRKETLLKTHEWLTSAGNGGILQVDAGDLFFSSSEVPETLKPQARIQSLGLARALKKTRMGVVVPGEKDFALGLEHYKKLIQESGAHAIAANLEVRAGRGKSSRWSAVLPASHRLILKVAGGKSVRITLVGLLGTELNLQDGIRATDPVAALNRLMPSLRKDADYVVALTHQGFDADQMLAQKVAGIDLIIGAHSQSFLQEPRQVGKTWIFQSSFRNQHVGMIRIATPGAAPEAILAELNAALDPPAGEPTEVRKIVEQNKKDIAQANLDSEKAISKAASLAAAEGMPKFQTFGKCAECHAAQFDFWRKTPHARAYEVLVKAGAHTNKECLACHSVGLADPEGYSELGQLAQWTQTQPSGSNPVASPSPTPDLAAWLADLRDARSVEKALEISRGAKKVHATVQCENCHLPVRDHPFGLESNPAKVAKNTCLGCHTPARAPTWYHAEAGGNGKLDDDKLQQNFAKMSCPRDETAQ
jgi:hypothetical protein